MQKVKFSGRYEHITPTVTTVFSAGAEETVSNEIAEAARAAGKLEKSDGGQPDKEVRRAVLPLVKATPAVSEITTRIYPGTTPPNPTFPFGRIDGFNSLPLDGPCHAGAQVSFLLHGFARDREQGGQVVETAEDVACRLGSGMKLAVHNKRIPVDDGSCLLRVRSVRLQPDAFEAGVYQSVLECEARVLAA